MNKRAADLLIFGSIVVVMSAYYVFLATNIGNYQAIMDGTVVLGIVLGFTIPFLPAGRIVPAGAVVLLGFLPAWHFGLLAWEKHSPYRNVLGGLGPEIGTAFGVTLIMGLMIGRPVAMIHKGRRRAAA